MTSSMPIDTAFPDNPSAKIGSEPSEGPNVPSLQNRHSGYDINDAAGQTGQDRDVAIGALLKCRKLRPELRFDSKTAPT